jgi:hypothetical protein
MGIRWVIDVTYKMKKKAIRKEKKKERKGR